MQTNDNLNTNLTETMSEPGKPETSSSSDSPASSSSSGSEVSTEIELSPSNQPIKLSETEPQSQPQPPAPPAFSSDDREAEEVGEEENGDFPPRSLSALNENPFPGYFPEKGQAPRPLSPPRDDPFSGQYPRSSESFRRSFAAIDDTFSSQPPDDSKPPASTSSQKLSWSLDEAQRPKTVGSHIRHGSFGPRESDSDTGRSNSLISEGRGISSPPRDVSESATRGFTAPAGFEQTSYAPGDTEWDHGSLHIGFRASIDARSSSMSRAAESNANFPVEDAQGKPESPFDVSTGDQIIRDTDPWTSREYAGLGSPSTASEPVSKFSVGSSAGLGSSESTGSSASSSDSDYHHEKAVEAAIDTPVSSLPVTRLAANNADLNEDSLFSSGLTGAEPPPRAAASVDEDRFISTQTAGQSESVTPPTSPQENINKEEANEASKFSQGSNTSNDIGSRRTVHALSGTKFSSSSSSSFSETEHEILAAGETSDHPPSSLTITPSIAATQDPTLVSTSSDAGQPVSPPLVPESSTAVASSGGRSASQTPSATPSPRSSPTQTISSVSNRRFVPLGQTVGATSRGKPSSSQTVSSVSQMGSHQTSPPVSPPSPVDSGPPPEHHSEELSSSYPQQQRQQTGLEEPSDSGPSSPVRSRGSIASGSTSPVTKKSSMFATRSSGIFRTGSAFRGARVSTDAVPSRATPLGTSRIPRPIAGSSRGGVREPQTAESRGTEEEKEDIRRASSRDSPDTARQDRAAAGGGTSSATESAAAADSQTPRSPPAVRWRSLQKVVLIHS